MDDIAPEYDVIVLGTGMCSGIPRIEGQKKVS